MKRAKAAPGKQRAKKTRRTPAPRIDGKRGSVGRAAATPTGERDTTTRGAADRRAGAMRREQAAIPEREPRDVHARPSRAPARFDHAAKPGRKTLGSTARGPGVKRGVAGRASGVRGAMPERGTTKRDGEMRRPATKRGIVGRGGAPRIEQGEQPERATTLRDGAARRPATKRRVAGGGGAVRIERSPKARGAKAMPRVEREAKTRVASTRRLGEQQRGAARAARVPAAVTTAPVFYALTVPGVEGLASLELKRAGATPLETLGRFDKRESLIRFTVPDAASLLRLGLAEDLFLVLLDAPTPPIRTAPKKLAALLEREALDRAMLVHHSMRPKERGRSFKVVARMAGQQPFLREDVEMAFGRAVAGLLPHWVGTREEAALEVWAHVIGERTIVGLRLTGDEFGQRTYKRAHLPASLKPTVARALVALSEPRYEDVFLDPMCGAGTILGERVAWGRVKRILGGDMDDAAIDASRDNVRRGASLMQWDATRLPIAGASVDVVVTNPPYGRQHDAEAGLDRLYARSTREIARVLRPGGRCVILTGEADVLKRALPPSLSVKARHRMLLRGLAVVAFVLVKA